MKINLNLSKNLPLLGILAFSLCSVWSLYNLLLSYAQHDTYIFLVPSILIEIVTAWSCYMVVDNLRKVTKSNQTKENRRFYTIIMVLFVVVAIPTLSVSVIANTIEFSGSWLLGSLFPIASVACAIGVALPDSVRKFEKQKIKETQERQAKRKKNTRQKQVAQARQQAELKRQQEVTSLMSSLGKAGETLHLYSVNPHTTQAQIAQELGVSPQAVQQHVVKLESMGLLDRSNGGIKVVTS